MALDQCLISGILYQVSGEVAGGIAVKIIQVQKTGEVIQQRGDRSDPSDTLTGAVSFEVPRASKAWLSGKFYIGSTNFNVTGGVEVDIPDAATASLESLGAAVSAPTSGITVEADGVPVAGLRSTFNFPTTAFTLDTSVAGVLGIALAAAGGASAWGGITGTLSAQTDLQALFDAIGPRNAANGYAGLSAGGLLTESQIPSSIARDSEVTALTDALTAALALKANLISPSFTTPVLGVASATSLNNLFFPDANTVDQRNGITPQAHQVYNTYTNASNYERAIFVWSGQNFVIGTSKAGSGLAADLSFMVNNSQRWRMELTNGNFIAVTDNATDIGASGSNRPRTGYFGTSVVAPVFKTTTALVTSIDGASNPTFLVNSIGSTGGPTTAAQNGWMKAQDSSGATVWIPVFK